MQATKATRGATTFKILRGQTMQKLANFALHLAGDLSQINLIAERSEAKALTILP